MGGSQTEQCASMASKVDVRAMDAQGTIHDPTPTLPALLYASPSPTSQLPRTLPEKGVIKVSCWLVVFFLIELSHLCDTGLTAPILEDEESEAKWLD